MIATEPEMRVTLWQVKYDRLRRFNTGLIGLLAASTLANAMAVCYIVAHSI